MLLVEMSSCTRKMYGGAGSNARVAFRKRMAEQKAFNAKYQAAKNKAAANAQASKSIVSTVSNMFSAAPAVEKAVNNTVIAAENAQAAVTKVRQNNSPAAAAVAVNNTQIAVSNATAAVNKSRNLLNLANRANSLAKNLRSMTGGRRRGRRTRRRRN
jgi:hypothetical protein